MVLNPHGRGRTGRGNFYNEGCRVNGMTNRGTTFTCGSTRTFFPHGAPTHGPRARPGTSGFNRWRPGFNRFKQRNCYMKYMVQRNKSEAPEIDMTMPWVTEEIKMHNQKKEELLQIWRKTKNDEDWNKYKTQKLDVEAKYEKAKTEYSASHPYEVSHFKSMSKAKNYFCETCDKSFRTEDDLVKHEAEHETCYCDGCEFTAHPKIIAKHIKMQHESGLYKRIGKLYTEEDIAKWIEERKRRYPTRKVIEDKKILEVEKLKRGERIKEDDSRFNKSFSFQSKSKGHRKQNFEKRVPKTKRKQTRKKNAVPTPSALIEEEQNENFLKGVPAFAGIRNTEEAAEPVKNETEISDEEWETECKIPNKVEPLLNSSLKLLADIYNSDEEDDNEETVKEIKKCVSDDEGSAPEEVKTVSSRNSVDEEKPNCEKVPIKRKYAGKQEIRNRKRRNVTNQRDVEKPRQTLLEKLLKNEIRRERNIILQCIHYVVNKNFFKVDNQSQ